jgi:hypothetical protein
VTFAVTLTAKPVRVARGKSFELFGTLAPGKAGESVTLDRKRGGSWIKVGTARLAKQKLPNGKRTLGYVFLARSSKKGALTFHVVAGPTVANAAGTSNQVTVTIT